MHQNMKHSDPLIQQLHFQVFGLRNNYKVWKYLHIDGQHHGIYKSEKMKMIQISIN